MADYYSNTSVVYRLHLGIWVNSQNVANNTTNLGYYLDFENTGSSSYAAHNYEGENFYLSIHGQVVFNSSVTWSLGGGQKKRICSGSLNVTHHDDGTLDVGCNFSRTANTSAAYYPGNLSGWADYFLPTIPRASSISASPTSQNFGSAITFTISRATTAFTHTLRYSYGGTTGTIATGVATSSSWTVPTSLATKTPNTASSTATIYCDTYNGSTKIGTKSCTVTLNCPSSWVPTVSSVTVSDSMANKPSAMSGIWIQGKSQPKVTAASGSGSNGSTLSSWSHVMEGVTVSGQTPQLNTIKGSGSINISTAVTDSRGRKSAAKSITLTVQPYANPTITKFSAVRSTDGVADDEGTQAKFEVSWAVSSVTSKNACSVKVQRQTSSGWVDVASVASPAYSGTATLTTPDDMVLSVDSSYTFRAVVADSFTTAQAQATVSTSYTLLNFGADGKSIGVAGLASSGKLTNELPYYMGPWSEAFCGQGTAGTAGWIKVMGIKIDTTYINSPIEVMLTQRQITTPIRLSIAFAAHSSKDPDVSFFVIYGTDASIARFKLVKETTSTWALWVQKVEGYDRITVHYVHMSRYLSGVNVTFPGTFSTSAPSGGKTPVSHRLYEDLRVGAFIMTISSTNPGSYLGGTWVQDLQGRSPIGVGTGSDGTTSKTFSAGNTGGEYAHKLATTEIPAHNHTTPVAWDNASGVSTAIWSANSCQRLLYQMSNGYGVDSWNTGGGGIHNTLHPYYGVYIWRRTA